MLPREFIAAFGRPVSRLQVLGVDATFVIPAHPDRNLLVFWSAFGDLGIIPAVGDTAGMPGQLFSGSSVPIILTHALHGSLVNIGWSVTSGALGGTLVWIEGYMNPTTLTRKVPTNATKLQAIQRDSRPNVKRTGR